MQNYAILIQLKNILKYIFQLPGLIPDTKNGIFQYLFFKN